MFSVMVVVHLLVSFCLIAVVLMQSGKGNGLSGAFGMGGNATVFGGRGAVDFLGKATWILGGAFMVTSLVLAILSGANSGPATGSSLIKKQATGAPAVPGPSAPGPGSTEPGGPGSTEPSTTPGTTPMPGTDQGTSGSAPAPSSSEPAPAGGK